MVSMAYPSRWKNNKTNKEWDLTFDAACGGEGKPGVLAQCVTEPNGKGKIYWRTVAATTLDLLYIISFPRRSGLGSLLTFAFADYAVENRLNNAKIASANPAEHGFYKYMGFNYDQQMLQALDTAASQSNDPDERVRLWSPMTFQDDDGKDVMLLRAQMACELVADSNLVRAKSNASADRTWSLVVGA